MMSRFTTVSKVRGVYGTALRKDLCYEGIKVSSAPDAEVIEGNSKFIAVITESIEGGNFVAFTHDQCGRLSNVATFDGNASPVIDLEFSPFNDHLIASGSDDALVMLWEIPDGDIAGMRITSKAVFRNHTKKITSVNFHPTANNCLASVSADLDIVFWDLNQLSARHVLSCHDEAIASLTWNYNGSMCATSSKDKILRVIDIRGSDVVSSAQSHSGTKSSRLCWLSDSPYILSTGFNRIGSRQLFVWDTRNLEKPTCEIDSESGSGVLIPLFDPDTNIVYCAGRGDSGIGFYEWLPSKGIIEYISSYNSIAPQRGVCMLPKIMCDRKSVEVARILKVHPNLIEPISFKIPRRVKSFSNDIFVDTIGVEPPMDVDEFFEGKDADPIKISLGEEGILPARISPKKPLDVVTGSRKENKIPTPKEPESPQIQKPPESPITIHKRSHSINSDVSLKSAHSSPFVPSPNDCKFTPQSSDIPAENATVKLDDQSIMSPEVHRRSLDSTKLSPAVEEFHNERTLEPPTSPEDAQNDRLEDSYDTFRQKCSCPSKSSLLTRISELEETNSQLCEKINMLQMELCILKG